MHGSRGDELMGAVSLEDRKTIRKSIYTAVGGLFVVGAINALSMYNQSQIFKDTTQHFIETQAVRNQQQDTANEQFKIAIAELKQQSADQSKRLDLVENRPR